MPTYDELKNDARGQEPKNIVVKRVPVHLEAWFRAYATAVNAERDEVILLALRQFVERTDA